MGREVCFSRVELATLARPHDVGSISDHGGPVKTLSRISSLPSGMGMHRCKTPEGLRLYSSWSIRMKDLARLARRRA